MESRTMGISTMETTFMDALSLESPTMESPTMESPTMESPTMESPIMEETEIMVIPGMESPTMEILIKKPTIMETNTKELLTMEEIQAMELPNMESPPMELPGMESPTTMDETLVMEESPTVKIPIVPTTIIYVKSTEETICKQKKNSFYLLPSPSPENETHTQTTTTSTKDEVNTYCVADITKDVSSSSSSSQGLTKEATMIEQNKYNPFIVNDNTFNHGQTSENPPKVEKAKPEKNSVPDELECEKDSKKVTYSSISTTSANEEMVSKSKVVNSIPYNPSQVFLSWINEGVTEKKSQRNKIQLTYSKQFKVPDDAKRENKKKTIRVDVTRDKINSTECENNQEKFRRETNKGIFTSSMFSLRNTQQKYRIKSDTSLEESVLDIPMVKFNSDDDDVDNDLQKKRSFSSRYRPSWI